MKFSSVSVQSVEYFIAPQLFTVTAAETPAFISGTAQRYNFALIFGPVSNSRLASADADDV